LQSIENAKIENFLHPDFSGSQTRTCTAVARRCLVEKIIEGDPYLHKSGYFKIGDTQIWAEMSQVSSIHFIDYSLATYLVQSESASNTTSPLRNLKFRLSCSEMYAYLCDKYSVSDDLSKYHNKKVNSLMLRIAFSTRDVELSERVRARNADFKLKEWLFYKGASGGFFYYLVRISLYFRRLIGGVDPLWKF
jgi:hypothetical protein